jgi:hypothetical protein
MKGDKTMKDFNTKDEVIWLDPKELFRIYGFSVSRQAALRSMSMIPYYKRGRYIRYKKSDIDAWLDLGKMV